ncbi:MAG: potassium channel protein [bacterium]
MSKKSYPMAGNGLGGYNAPPVSSTYKLTVALAGLTFVVVAGTVGFMITEGSTALDALYLTVTTLSTVGYGDLVPHGPVGKIVAMLIILFGVLTGAYAATSMGEIVLEGQFREVFGRKKMRNKISKMSGHYIIAGFGRVGQQVALEFARRKVSFLVIEREPDPIRRLTNCGYFFLEGEATRDDVLEAAGIDKAHTLISTLPDEAQNVYLTLSARSMNRKLNIIARADYDGGEQKLMRAGANHVVSPHVIGGQRMAMATLRPHVVDFMTMTAVGDSGLSIEEIMVPVGCKLVGQTLMESRLKETYGVTVIGIKKPGGEMTITPGPKAVLEESVTLVVVGPNEGLERLSQDLGE